MANRARPQHHTIRHGFQTLHDTSQGSIFDLPPDRWIQHELIEFGAFREDGLAQKPRLDGELHPVFARSNWRSISDRRYEALRQSMLLTTKLIELSGATFASALPDFRQNTKRSRRALAVPLADNAPSQDVQERIKTAKDLFESQAPDIQWVEDEEMLRNKEWLGINAPWQDIPPFSYAEDLDWEDPDNEGHYGDDRRGVLIGISSTFADRILSMEEGTQEHLWTVFYAGVTMTHELGHWLYTGRVASKPARGEPYFGDNVEMEMGNAYIGWLFGGFRPEMILTTDDSKDNLRFNRGLCWLPMHNCGDTRPVYETKYSMSIRHVESIMDQGEWDSLSHLTGEYPGVVRAMLLHPKPFQMGENERIAEYYRSGTGGGKLDETGFVDRTNKRFIYYEAAPFAYVDLYWNPTPRKTALEGDNPEGARLRTIKNLQGRIQKLSETLRKQQSRLQNLSAQVERDDIDLADMSESGAGVANGRSVPAATMNSNQNKRQELVEQIRETTEKIADAANKVADVLPQSGALSTTQNVLVRTTNYKRMLTPFNRGMKKEEEAPRGPASGAFGRSLPGGGGPQNTSPGSSRAEAIILDADDDEPSQQAPARVPFNALPENFRNLIMRINDLRDRPEKYTDDRPEVCREDENPERRNAAGRSGRNSDAAMDDYDDDEDPEDDPDEDGYGDGFSFDFAGGPILARNQLPTADLDRVATRMFENPPGQTPTGPVRTGKGRLQVRPPGRKSSPPPKPTGLKRPDKRKAESDSDEDEPDQRRKRPRPADKLIKHPNETITISSGSSNSKKSAKVGSAKKWAATPVKKEQGPPSPGAEAGAGYVSGFQYKSPIKPGKSPLKKATFAEPIEDGGAGEEEHTITRSRRSKSPAKK